MPFMNRSYKDKDSLTSKNEIRNAQCEGYQVKIRSLKSMQPQTIMTSPFLQKSTSSNVDSTLASCDSNNDPFERIKEVTCNGRKRQASWDVGYSLGDQHFSMRAQDIDLSGCFPLPGGIGSDMARTPSTANQQPLETHCIRSLPVRRLQDQKQSDLGYDYKSHCAQVHDMSNSVRKGAFERYCTSVPSISVREARTRSSSFDIVPTGKRDKMSISASYASCTVPSPPRLAPLVVISRHDKKTNLPKSSDFCTESFVRNRKDLFSGGDDGLVHSNLIRSIQLDHEESRSVVTAEHFQSELGGTINEIDGNGDTYKSEGGPTPSRIMVAKNIDGSFRESASITPRVKLTPRPLFSGTLDYIPGYTDSLNNAIFATPKDKIHRSVVVSDDRTKTIDNSQLSVLEGRSIGSLFHRDSDKSEQDSRIDVNDATMEEHGTSNVKTDDSQEMKKGLHVECKDVENAFLLTVPNALADEEVSFAEFLPLKPRRLSNDVKSSSIQAHEVFKTSTLLPFKSVGRQKYMETVEGPDSESKLSWKDQIMKEVEPSFVDRFGTKATEREIESKINLSMDSRRDDMITPPTMDQRNSPPTLLRAKSSNDQYFH